MKKIMMLVLVILLCGFIINTASNSITEPYPNLSFPLKQNAGALDFKAVVNTPGKDGALNKEALMTKAASIAIPFVKNVGQFNVKVKYAADLFAGRFFLTHKELVYSLFKRSDKKGFKPDKRRQNAKLEEKVSGNSISFREFFVDQKGEKIDFKSSGEQQTETVVSYFKGNDPKKWRSGVTSYQGVSLGQVYPGVEVKLKASGRNVEKVFYVSPQGSIDAIKIGVAGVAGLKIEKDGRLLFKNSLGELAMRAPIAWQEISGQRHEVKVGYRLLSDHLYGFAVLGDYNKKCTLIIDPDLDTLGASTFLGGSSSDSSTSLALDRLGNVYVTGETASTDFPTTSGVFDQSHNGINDVFISKLNSGLTKLLASTFLGGYSVDLGYSLALDSVGNVYVTGETWSTDFPTTDRAYDQSRNGWCDAFVSKLDSNLNKLLASTFLGGRVEDRGYSLALDSSGNVYVIGQTNSTNFPTTSGTYDQTYNSINVGADYGDVFVSRLNNNFTLLLASTFLGGSSWDGGKSLALDNLDNVYVTGMTYSSDFPTTAGAYSQNHNQNGYCDAFISKFNKDLTTLLASTYLGGNSLDNGTSLALDNWSNIYLTGVTVSADFPTTPGAYDRTYNDIDVFVSKLDSNLTMLLASTYLGGSSSDSSTSLALDSVGNVYLTGDTWSEDFPTNPEAYDRTYNDGHYDAFVSKLNSSLTTLLSSTFLGGGHYDFSKSLALDCLGYLYLTGYTNSTDFPFTFGAYDENFIGSGDSSNGFIAKLNISAFVKLDLQAERRKARAFSILRQYGQVQCTVEINDIPVTQYLIMRRQGSSDFVLLKTIDPSELQNNQFQIQDKYLEKNSTYTYRVEAYDAAEQLVGKSWEKTI